MFLRNICGCWLVLAFIPVAGRAQTDSTTGAALIAALTPALVTEIHARPRAVPRLGHPQLAYAVRVPGIGVAAELAFRDAILQASGARAATAMDSSLFRVKVENFTVTGDSAVVDIDLGYRWCYAGYISSVGTEYSYRLVRSATSAWHYLRREAGITYDPPPPPPPGTQPRGCPKDIPA